MLKSLWTDRSIHTKLIILCLFSIVPYWLFMSQYMIPLVYQDKVNERKESLSRVIDIVFSELSEIQERQLKGDLSLEEAQSKFKNLILRHRYAKTEYIWIHDLDGVMQMHPINAKLNSTNILSMKDPEGNPLFENMNILVKKEGAGFIRYLWPKPGSDKPQPKISYVRLDPKWNWVLGTGVYIDDIDSSISALNRNIYLVYILISVFSLFIFYRLSSRLVKRIDSLSVDVAASSTQITEVSQSIARGGQSVSLNTQKSNHTIQSSLSSLRTLHEISQTNRQESHGVVKLSKESKDAAVNGYEKLKELNQAIADLAKTNEKVIQSMNVIDDIAFQTNLLALNASVEAARAGEAGRGFAVVADAVRGLALKSSEAAKEVRAVTEESKSKTDASVDLAAKGMDNLRELSESFIKVVEINEKIAKSSDQQNDGVQQVEKDIKDISEIMVGFAKNAHETAVDSYELSAYATAVINQINKMNIQLMGRSKGQDK